MPFQWTQPTIVTPGTIFRSADYNEQVGDNLRWLKSRGQTIVQGLTAGTYTLTNGASFLAIDDTYFRLDFDTYGGGIKVGAAIPLDFGAGLPTMYFDWLLDATTYLSSGTGTPNANGLAHSRLPSGYEHAYYFEWFYPSLAAGTHSLALRGRANAANAVIGTATDPFQIWVQEY